MVDSNIAEFAKKRLIEFVPEIDVRIAKYFDGELEKEFGFNDKQRKLVEDILGHSKEYILRPTKRLRASLVHYGFMLSGKKPDDKVWEAAMATELVHAALLMHDDFMDLDVSRRGGPTTHKYFEKKFKGSRHYGEAMAVNTGDALLCLGFELLAKCGGGDGVITQMLRSIANTAYGQAYDVSLENFGKWSEDDVMTVHKAKTAIYTYENPLFIGAQLANLPDQVLSILHEYSMDAGVAFQLRDDILGVFGDPSETGKSADSDLLQGKCTLLVLKALDRVEVQKVWGKRKARKYDIELAKQAILDSGSLEYSKQKTITLAGKAVKTANKLRELGLDSGAVDYIAGIAQYMVERVV